MTTPSAAGAHPAAPCPSAQARRWRQRHSASAFLMLSPWLIGLVVLTIGPMAMSLWLSFTNFDLLTAPDFVGARNYAYLLRDPRYAQSLWVTFIYVAVSVPLKLVVALALALLLAKASFGIGPYRAIFYLPSLLGGSVATAIVWRIVFGADGIFNVALGWFGIEGRSWISTPDTALSTLIALSVWQFGAPMVIFLAALKQIPADLYEAAAIDGAGPARMFFSITLPLLTPIVFFNLVLQVINAFQTFTPSYVISGGTGGPSDTTLLYSLYLYLEAFTKLRMGYASAMAWVLLAIIGVITAALFATSGRWVFYADKGDRT
ncbi:MAG: carbohydrate ABC transporter permease [Devosia sp.]